ncbi:nucleotidyltransferase domain-containing protein [Candidatus Woesearchaeota archaeon]|nr:MAG: nucleotidyltransferase domain-containing protein [Candidatus Woesearchaeota archaeon]
MEFEVPKHEKENLEKYSDEAKDLAYEFSKRLLKEMRGLIKGIVLFGSAARKRQKSNDIDILIVVDDLSIELTKPLIQGYRIIVKKLVADVSEKLHITTLRYTTFWEYTRAGDPVGVNILRDGVALYDTGFFAPLQRLLYTGRIRPSAESIWTYFGRTGISLENAKGKLLGATLDLYWAVMDASHAALMRVGEVPPSPEHVPAYLKEKLVKTGLLEAKWPGICKEFYHLMKNISHREVKEISGELHDHYAKLAKDYVERMKRIIEQ